MILPTLPSPFFTTPSPIPFSPRTDGLTNRNGKNDQQPSVNAATRPRHYCEFYKRKVGHTTEECFKNLKHTIKSSFEANKRLFEKDSHPRSESKAAHLGESDGMVYLI